ncbi:MAG TPA: orotate phosphoribosyltransferase [Thermodesulfobacteriota bacterium]|nr:orotate phosphoribosyltransferase [Thermodesulfobacteriota bacterium]
MRDKLLNILFEKSFRYDPDKGFLLSSGAKSDMYVDAKKTVLSAEGMVLTGRLLFERIKNDSIDGIGGLTLGADPLAYAAALVSNMEGKPLNVFIVRKEPKKHGTEQWIEGPLKPGARVVIVDDVVTTGASTIKAVEKAIKAGFKVVKALVLLDREEGGRQNVEKHCAFESLFTRKDLLDLRAKKLAQEPKKK